MLSYAGLLVPVALVDGAGNAQGRQVVDVLNVDGTTATVYADAARTALTGAVASDATGNVSGVYAEPGVYRLRFSVLGVSYEVQTVASIDPREITDLHTLVTGNSGSVSAEATARTAADSAESSARAAADSAEAALRASGDTNETNTRAAADAAEAALRASLAATEAADAAAAATANGNEVTARAAAVLAEQNRALAAEAANAASIASNTSAVARLTLTTTATKTAAYTAAPGDLIPVSTAGGPVTVTLPAAPATGTLVAVKHTVQGGTNTVTIAASGTDHFNTSTGPTTATLTLLNQAVHLQYAGGVWLVVADDLPLSQLDGRFLTPSAAAGAYALLLKPEAYGAAASYNVAADDTAAVQAAANAAVAAGGVLYLSRTYNLLTGPVTVNGQITIQGTGGKLNGNPIDSTNPRALATLRCAGTTASALVLNGVGGHTLRDFAVVNENGATVPTSGTGIQVLSASQSKVDGVSVVGFYNNIETSGVFFAITGCHLYDASNYSLWLHNTGTNFADHGDLSVSGCVIAQNYKTWSAAAAIRWESGGGVKITGNKILGGAAIGNTSAGGGNAGGHFSYGIDFMVADSVSTGDANITGNSISNFNIAGIRFGVQGSTGTAGYFTYATIVGNNINVGFATANVAIFGGVDAVYDRINNIEFSGNTIQNVPYGIIANSMVGLHIGANTWGSLTGSSPYLVSLAPSPGDGTKLLGVQVDKQMIGRMTGVDLIIDARHQASDIGALTGIVDHAWGDGFYANSVGTWVTLGYVDLGVTIGGTAELELLLTGYDFGVGPMFARYRRLLSKASGSSAVTVATDGTDTTAGAGSHYAVQFVTTTNNRVIVQVQLTTGSATIWGRARITPRGDIARSHKGT